VTVLSANLSPNELKELLDERAEFYEQQGFIEEDPISIPHHFSSKEDIEISGFLAATLAWGQRKTIIRNAKRLMEGMDHAPHDFLMNFEAGDLKRFEGFVHRTFNYTDLSYFISRLSALYRTGESLETLFLSDTKDYNQSISRFKQLFFESPHEQRTQKHVADPNKGSTAKRLHMYLRWMIRSNKTGVDFGIWKSGDPSRLMLPLDVHTGRVARQLGLLTRIANDAKAVEEVTENLRKLDLNDPAKYDFALFGLGVSGVI
jgi:uncharacterized protein (TIGR02757 family)